MCVVSDTSFINLAKKVFHIVALLHVLAVSFCVTLLESTLCTKSNCGVIYLIVIVYQPHKKRLFIFLDHSMQ